MSQSSIFVIATPGASTGFALAGLHVIEADDEKDAARELAHLEGREGIVIIDQRLYGELPGELRRSTGRWSTPIVIPVPGPTGARSRRHTITSSTSFAGDRVPREAPMNETRITRVAGAIAEAKPLGEAALYELVEVGERRLLGEVIRLRGDVATIQVFEETTGLSLEEPVRRTGSSLETQLGPGLLGSILDGVGRPLQGLADHSGDFIAPGATLPTLDPGARWSFAPTAEVGASVESGDVLGVVEEKPRPDSSSAGTAGPPRSGLQASKRERFTVSDPIATFDDGSTLSLSHPWPIRKRRPMRRRLPGIDPSSRGNGCSIFSFLWSRGRGGGAGRLREPARR